METDSKNEIDKEHSSSHRNENNNQETVSTEKTAHTKSEKSFLERHLAAVVSTSISAAAVIVSATQVFLAHQNDIEETQRAMLKETLSYSQKLQQDPLLQARQYVLDAASITRQEWGGDVWSRDKPELDQHFKIYINSRIKNDKQLHYNINVMRTYYSDLSFCVDAGACDSLLACHLFFGEVQQFLLFFGHYWENDVFIVTHAIDRFLNNCENRYGPEKRALWDFFVDLIK